MAPLADRPHAFFGHSMGALLAYELARELRRRALPGPCHPCSCPAGSRPRRRQ
ncbi:thioesterase domain-containing protein [Streptomyces lividans]